MNDNINISVKDSQMLQILFLPDLNIWIEPGLFTLFHLKKIKN